MVGNIQAGCVALLPLFTAWCMRPGQAVCSIAATRVMAGEQQ